MPRPARGRGFGPGLVLLPAFAAVLTACGPEGPGPVAWAVDDYVPPEVETGDAGTRVVNHGPRERLHVYETLPERGARLLFLAGRSATLLENGRSAWPDHDGSRVIVFDDRGVVDEVLQGGTPDGRRLEQPAFVASRDDGLLAVEPDGNGLLFRDGRPVRWIEPHGTGPVSGPAGRLAAARTVFDIPLRPLKDGAPLLWVHREDGRPEPVGRADRPRVPLLGSLVNSGWTAVDDDGAVFFASAVRPELRRYDPEGRLAWTAVWPPDGEVRDPRFRYDGEGLSPHFTLVQKAFTPGPDGHLYVLAPELQGTRDRILVFDRDGTLLRTGRVPRDAAVYADRTGHVYRTAAEDALARTAVTERTAFPPFDLPGLGDDDAMSLADLEGRVAVVNFWASWCAPCRGEIPLLDEFAGELDPEEAVVVGINEDVSPRDGLAFLEELGGVDYPMLEGRGRQRSRYRYRGLPYTVVLDPEGRIVRTVYGFGTSIAPIRTAVHQELERIRRASDPDSAGTRAPTP